MQAGAEVPHPQAAVADVILSVDASSSHNWLCTAFSSLSDLVIVCVEVATVHWLQGSDLQVTWLACVMSAVLLEPQACMHS
jgi:hypothetical protein